MIKILPSFILHSAVEMVVYILWPGNSKMSVLIFVKIYDKMSCLIGGPENSDHFIQKNPELFSSQ